MSTVSLVTDAFDYCKPPSGSFKADRLYLFNLGITLFILLILCSMSDRGMSVTSEYSVMFLSFLVILYVS